MVDWKSLFEKGKSFSFRVLGVYLEFAVPIAMFFAFNVACASHSVDSEKLGLMYLHSAQMEPEDRITKFPLQESGQKGRAKKPAPEPDMA